MRYFALGVNRMGFTLEGKLSIEITGASEIEAKIRSTTIETLQGQIHQMAEQILKELAHADWPAGRATNTYVATGELADAVVVEGGGTNLTIRMDGSRMSMVPPVASSNGKLGNWGVHMGVRSQPYNTEMPALLNYGGGGLVQHTGTGYFEEAFGIYESEFIHILADALRGAGFDVTEG